MNGPVDLPLVDETEVDVTEHLAGVLRMEIEQFVEVWGAGWTWVTTETWHDLDADPSWGEGRALTRWAISGSPPQVMAHVFHHGAYVAQPLGTWTHGTHGLAYQPDRPRYVRRDDLDAVRETVRDVVGRRRRSFTWCRSCRTLQPPELREDRDTCMGCASRWQGVVF